MLWTQELAWKQCSFSPYGQSMQLSRWQQWPPWPIQGIAEEIKRLSAYWLNYNRYPSSPGIFGIMFQKKDRYLNTISIDRISSPRHFEKREVSSSHTSVEWKCTHDLARYWHGCEARWLLGKPFTWPSLTAFLLFLAGPFFTWNLFL